MVRGRRSREDRRAVLLSPTAAGARALRASRGRALREAAARLAPLAPGERARLAACLDAAGALLAGRPPSTAPVVLRGHRPGDLGWVVERHGALHARERGRGGPLEWSAAGAAAGFLRRHDPRRERCWIAERDGERLGSVLLLRRAARTAEIRLLLVEPEVRGPGLGGLLVAECLRFAAEAGYRRILLRTDAVLPDARRLCERAGFRRERVLRRSKHGGRRTAERWGRSLP
jgi:GNAT superfamily N-acetyltransferase